MKFPSFHREQIILKLKNDDCKHKIQGPVK